MSSIPPPTAEDLAFRSAIVEAPEDACPQLLYADWLDERNRIPEAAYWRFRGETPGLIHGDNPEKADEDPYALCVYLDLDSLPDGLGVHLPAPMIHRHCGRESERAERILLDLWVCREACERDLLAAWLVWWPVRQKTLFECAV